MDHDAATLGHLIARLRGAASAFRRAGADGPGLSDAFGGAADAHDRTAQALEAVVHASGGTVDPDGAVHPGDLDLTQAVMAGPLAVREAVARLELGLAAAFHHAVADGEVSVAVREAIMRAGDDLRAARDQALQRLPALGG